MHRRGLVRLIVILGATAAAAIWLGATILATPNALIVYCAVSVRPDIEPAIRRYESGTGTTVTLQLGPSGGLETQIRLTGRGDLYVPAAVRPFLDRMRDERLVEDLHVIAKRRLVLATQPDGEVPAASLAELIQSGQPFGICNVQAAAGECLRRTLEPADEWDRVAGAATASFPTVNELAEAVRNGGRLRYGIVWDATAKQFGLTAIDVAELSAATADVGVAVLLCSEQPEAARRLARYLAETTD